MRKVGSFATTGMHELIYTPDDLVFYKKQGSFEMERFFKWMKHHKKTLKRIDAYSWTGNY